MAVISDNFIERLTLGSRKELIVRDSKLTGFALRVRRQSDGKLSRSFFVGYEVRSTDGTRNRKKASIGNYPTFSAPAARKEAERMLQAVQRGEDPTAERRAKREAPLFKALADEYVKEYVPTRKAGTAHDYKERIKRRLVPHFGEIKVADITPAMIRDFIRKGDAKPTDTNRCVAVLSSMMRYAVEATPPLRETNPCAGIRRLKEGKREAYLDEHDLPLFLRAVEEHGGGYRDILLFMTVTGWRVSEARTLRWDQIDLKRQVAHLGDTKTGAQTRHLSTDAMTLIDRQAHRMGYVFSTQKGRSAPSYTGIYNRLVLICDKAGIKRISPHVLRHTAASWAAIDGATAHELKETFGWATLAMTGRYVGRAEALARKGVERAASAINVFGNEPAEVVDLDIARKKVG